MNYKAEYSRWCKYADEETQKQLKNLSEEEISDSFYKSLEFGTGGLRGIMGAGTNRMNAYTVRQATQGLADEINSLDMPNKSVVIAYDSRNSSAYFAAEAARVLTANKIKVYLFESLRPTPELSFAVRFLKCTRGIVITASHNPKEYNGYKVYGEDGGQIPPEAAEKIQKFILGCDIFKDVKYKPSDDFISVGSEVDDEYIKSVKNESLGIEIPSDFSAVYTPLHGAGNKLVRRVLGEIGVKNLFCVPEQEQPDGDFSTVSSPNPENAEAFDIAVKYAKERGADLVLATDPDSDRIGVAVNDGNGEYVLLNGNQTGALLTEFILRKTKVLPSDATVVKTLVTTDLCERICESFGVKTVNVPTGFKYIGEKIKEFEQNGKNSFVFGLEESYGYLKGTYARDKDAVVAAMLICEMTADYKTQNVSLHTALMNLYKKYGFCKNLLVSKTCKGREGVEKINELMRRYRSGNVAFGYAKLIDYKNKTDSLPKLDMIKFVLDDGWVAVRPSGTEPKIKYYFEIFAENESTAEKRISSLFEALN